MRISYQWLGDFVDLEDVSPHQAAELLTMSGTKVESIKVIDLAGILVGRVVSQQPHPGQTRTPLWVHEVDIGERVVQVIAGAPNAVPGSLVPLAPPGSVTPSGKEVREKIRVVGVEGWGMMCSAAELNLDDDHSGILLLDQGEPGWDLARIFPLEAILEAEVTSNRPDCLGHLGIARELAAAGRIELRWDFMSPFTGGVDPPGRDLVEVSIEDPDLCRRYIGAVVKGVRVGPSPSWMQRRLRAVGLRPINNVVDISNYVMLEYGQPSHVFDLDRLEGPRIIVRRARAGEELLCLDGERYRLGPQMLVIADAVRPVALAGVIGGLESAVTDSTVDVLLEAATFDGPNVRATARTLGLRTDASSRFEKGLSPELALAGARRAATLLRELAGGVVHRDWADNYPRPQEPVRVRVWPERIDSLLGVHVPLEDSEDILRRLGFHLRIEADGAWDVLPPVFRLDVTIPEDVVEEVGRIYGPDRIPATLPGHRTHRWMRVRSGRPLERIKEVMLGAGFSEVVTPALTSHHRLQALGLAERAMVVANPLSDSMNALRTSLVPSLLEVAALNRNHGRERVRLFEQARVYLRQDQDPHVQPLEPERLAVVRDAGGNEREALLQLKALIDRCAVEAGVRPPAYRPATATGFHPGRCAEVWIGELVGYLGEIHPAALQELGLEGRMAGFEIEAKVFDVRSPVRQVKPLPRFPAVERDLALVVGESTSAADLLAVIGRAGGELLESVRAFDEYRGRQLGSGLKSVAFGLTYRSQERTLTDAEVETALVSVRSTLERSFGAKLRE